jgi:hypothetical protein
MFWQQFQMYHEDFEQLYTAFMQHLVMKKGYDTVKHSKMASKSSGSPISLELQLYVTPRLLSGASYLDMVWYAVSQSSVHELFWKTVCIIDSAISNIQFPQDSTGVALIVDGWAKKEARHGLAAKMGTVLAVDGFVLKIKKPSAASLLGQSVDGYRNHKGFWGLITYVGSDSNAIIHFVQTDWPGATNDITCFRQTPLFNALKKKMLPEYIHIVADEAYSALAAEFNGQILTPYSIHQLNAVKKIDDENQVEYFQHLQHYPALIVLRPVLHYWKLRAFNHEISSEQITIERVLGMLVRIFGIF